MNPDPGSSPDVDRLRSFGQLLGVELSEEEIRQTLAQHPSVPPPPAPRPDAPDRD